MKKILNRAVILSLTILFSCVSLNTYGEEAVERVAMQGGGIYMIDGKVINCTVNANSADDGFGIAAEKGDVINSTVMRNSATNAKIGDVFYTDGTFASTIFTVDIHGEVTADVPARSAEALGIVIGVSNDPKANQGIKYWLITTNLTANYDPLIVDHKENIVGLKNCDTYAEATDDMNGLKNTMAIYEHSKGKEGFDQSMTKRLKDMKVPTSFSTYTASQWYHPACAQLIKIVAIAKYINATLKALKKPLLPEKWVFSSTKGKKTFYDVSFVTGNIHVGNDANMNTWMVPIINLY